jgi:NADH-quinone oxidoreductase subunit M
MFGPLSNPKNRELKDLSARETAVFVPMVIMALWLGIYPSTFLSDIDPAVQKTVTSLIEKSHVTVDDGDPPKVVGQAPAAAPAPAVPMPVVVQPGGAE